eukprot:TRINITY_DN46277_c0_g1_i2.p1 TRINITY_DN46277_c0_g1~~TRINITY_DN46277_c0_g1_i2.p1  ORF type:complete len:700 (-),score=173.02 TRINITY_DN46277_c0_g1_i2:43-2142(-)
MEIESYSIHTNHPCFIVTLDGRSVLLDGPVRECFEEFSPSLHDERETLPRTHSPQVHKRGRVSPFEWCFPDVEYILEHNIETVLVSHPLSMAAIPALLESGAFHGRIFATRPTKDLGRIVLEEMLQVAESSAHRFALSHPSKKMKIKTDPLKEEERGEKMNCFSRDSVDLLMETMETIQFGEVKNVEDWIQITPYASGLTVGSSNWEIVWKQKRVVYLSGYGLNCEDPRHRSMDSTKFDTFGDFLPLGKGFDDRIFRSPLTGIIDGWSPFGPAFFRRDIVHDTMSFIRDVVERRKGKVLIACRSMVEHLQSIERVANALSEEGLRDVTVHVISPQARRLLKYIDSCAEWMHPRRFERGFEMESVTNFAYHIEKGRLKVWDVDDLYGVEFGKIIQNSKPDVFFATDGFLRSGGSETIFMNIQHDRRNGVVFAQPNVSMLELDQIFSPFRESSSLTSFIEASTLASPRKDSEKWDHAIDIQWLASHITDQQQSCPFVTSFADPGSVALDTNAIAPLQWHSIAEDDDVLQLIDPSDGDELFPCVVEFPHDKPLGFVSSVKRRSVKQEREEPEEDGCRSDCNVNASHDEIIARLPIRIHGAGGGDSLKLEAMEDDLGLSLPYYYGSCRVRSLLRSFEEECIGYFIDDSNLFEDYAASLVIVIEEPWKATITIHSDHARTEIAASSSIARVKCLQLIQACIDRV